MVDALQKALALKTLNIHAEDVFNWSWGADQMRFLNNEVLQTVYCRGTYDGPGDARKKLEKKLLRKLDARMSILIVIYILNYVSFQPRSFAVHGGAC